MKTFKPRPIFLLMILLLSSNSFAADSSDKNLYSRIGGYDAICLVVDNLMAKLANNARTKVYLDHIPVSRAIHVREQMVSFICSATGGPCNYLGQDMKSAHTGMKIDHRAWNATASLLTETLDELGVNDNNKKDLLDIVSTLKSQIVE